MTHSFYRSYGFLAAMLACIVLGCAVGAAEHDAGEHRGKEAVAPIEGMGHKKPSDLPDFCVYLYP